MTKCKKGYMHKDGKCVRFKGRKVEYLEYPVVEPHAPTMCDETVRLRGKEVLRWRCPWCSHALYYDEDMKLCQCKVHSAPFKPVDILDMYDEEQQYILDEVPECQH